MITVMTVIIFWFSCFLYLVSLYYKKYLRFFIKRLSTCSYKRNAILRIIVHIVLKIRWKQGNTTQIETKLPRRTYYVNSNSSDDRFLVGWLLTRAGVTKQRRFRHRRHGIKMTDYGKFRASGSGTRTLSARWFIRTNISPGWKIRRSTPP